MYIPTCVLVDEDDNLPSTDNKVSTLDFISDAVWNLTLPSGEDKPKVVSFPELNFYNDEDYQITKKGIMMQAKVNGITTKNSKYPRCEFRELNKDGSRASWDSKGVHELRVLTQVLELPTTKPEVCICQVHDNEDDVFEIRYEKNQVVVTGDILQSKVIVPDKIGLNQDINISISIDNSKTIIKINKFELIFSFLKKGCYFKAGCYTQANKTNGSGKGKVLLKKLWVKH